MIAFYFLTGRAQAARSNAVDLAIIQDEESVFNLRLTRVECRSERCTALSKHDIEFVQKDGILALVEPRHFVNRPVRQ